MKKYNDREKRSPARGSLAKRVFSVIGKVLLFLLVFLVGVCVFLFGLVKQIAQGPSPAARDLFVRSVMETSSAHFLAEWFLPEDQITAIVNAKLYADPPQKQETEIKTQVEIDPNLGEEEKKSLEIVEIKGPTYKGKLMIVRDPSRISLATSAPFTQGGTGLTLRRMVSASGSVAGINAGGFVDVEGDRGGDVPVGLVIRQGRLLSGETLADESGAFPSYDVIGFDRDHRLIVGRMTARQALAAGIADAVSFSPILIRNGVSQNINGSAGGLNPRTAIGQRADGAVLLLVLDGRQPQSLGATMSDLVKIMHQYGAVNAANLDGGSSTLMIYRDEMINKCCSLYGPRTMPTAFVVAAAEGDTQ